MKIPKSLVVRNNHVVTVESAAEKLWEENLRSFMKVMNIQMFPT